MVLTFALLGLAILSVWMPDIAVAGRFRIKPWIVLFGLSIASGLLHEVLTWFSLIPILVLVCLCALARDASIPVVRGLSMAAAAVLAVALAVHIVPGFNNPILTNAVRISEGSAPFTQYANFDKGAAGLILLAFLARRASSSKEIPPLVVSTLIAIALTSISVIVYALLASYVAFEPKIPEFALQFLAINLLFTCVAEEVFFRGVIQEQLMQLLSRNLQWVAVVASSLLFGVAHFAGGVPYVVLATIAGVGYSLVYARTRLVESAIVTHFGVNAIHFFGFTYPHLAR